MLAYGVRIIGEGHVVVDNLFYDLRGGEKKGFRSALSILNGVENSPLHGYFQVKDASVEGNVFINCPPPSIYSGFHTRPEAKLPPENISIKNNLIYCDSGRRGPAYIDELRPLNLRSEDNYVIGLLQPEGVKGFNSIRNKGIKRKGFDLTGLPQEVADKVFQSVAYPENSGASFIPPALKAAISERKYSFLLPADVGPVWFR